VAIHGLSFFFLALTRPVEGATIFRRIRLPPRKEAEMTRRNVRWPLAGLLLTGTFSQSASPQDTQGQDRIDSARRALSENRLTDAEKMFLGAIQEAQELGSAAVCLGEAQEGLAIVYSIQGKFSQAEALHKSAAETFEKVYGPDHSETWGAWNNLALLYRAEGKYAEAEPLFRKKAEDAEKRFGPESAVVAASVEQLADLYADQGKSAQAEPLYRQAVAMWQKAEGPEYPYATRMLFRLAEICRGQARSAEAESFYQQVIAIYDKHAVIRDRMLPKVLENYAALLRDEGRIVEASEVESRARRLKAREAQNPPN
jgi:tetratricopeptide (TPR) repeat protein